MLIENYLNKRILIIGSNGMLGQRVYNFFSGQEGNTILCSSAEDEPVQENIDYRKVDITKREEVKELINSFFPDVIINTAAYTNVDGAETQRETAWRVNVKAVEYIADIARVIDSHVVHISTDYVFDGEKGPYSEKDKVNPISYYGRTKLASENALRISGAFYSVLRTNVLYGIIKTGRQDFVRWVVNSVRSGTKINIVTDQFNNPTFLDDLVQAISKVIAKKKYGLYNIGGKEFINRYDFTLRIADYFKLDKSLINPIVTSDLKQPAKRPLRSGLITLKAETELKFKAVGVEESFSLMRNELNL